MCALSISRLLEVTDITPLAECYIKVFAQSPWNEYKKCTVCGKEWGYDEFNDYPVLNHCNQRVTDFWPLDKAIGKLEKVISINNYSCWIVKNNDEIVGFCWGYPILSDDLLTELKITIPLFSPKSPLVYLAEIGLLNEYRGQGLASILYNKFRSDISNKGYQSVVTKTKTLPPTVVYNWFKEKLGFRVIYKYNDSHGKVIMTDQD